MLCVPKYTGNGILPLPVYYFAQKTSDRKLSNFVFSFKFHFSVHTMDERKDVMTILTEKQIAKLKKQLIEQKHALLKNQSVDDEFVDRGSLRDAIDELSTVDNHPADIATELFEREKDLSLKVHQEDELAKINAALEKIENGTYGVCEVCKKEIPYDRLAAIPYTSFCIEHADAKNIPTDRPVEEDLLIPPVDNSFAEREVEGVIQDFEDTFQVVAKYGTSETPSDFEGDFEDFNELYDDPEEYANNDEPQSFHVSTKDEIPFPMSKREIEEASKYDYLE